MNDLLGRLLRLSENDAKRDYSCIMIEIPAPYGRNNHLFDLEVCSSVLLSVLDLQLMEVPFRVAPP